MRTDGILDLWYFICFEAIIVLVAIAVDLAAGLYKAKIRGEVRNSEGIKRTVSKFILYFGSLCIAAGMDSIFFAARFWDKVHLPALTPVPVIATIVSVLLLATEMYSVWEKADRKQRSDAIRTAQAITTLLNSDIIKAVTQATTVRTNKDNSDGSKDYRSKGIPEQ
jgi:hypothetical protein